MDEENKENQPPPHPNHDTSGDLQCPEPCQEIPTLNQVNMNIYLLPETEQNANMQDLLNMDASSFLLAPMPSDSENINLEADVNQPLTYELHILEPENPENNTQEEPSIINLAEADYETIEQIASMIYDTEEIMERRDQLKENEHKDYIQEFNALTQICSTPASVHPRATKSDANTMVSFIGNSVTDHHESYQIKCIWKLKHKMEQAEIIHKLTEQHQTCPECFRKFQSLPDHLKLGSFAAHHQLDSLPDHIKISLLLATTLTPTDDGFKPRYPTYLEPFQTNNSQNIDLSKIDALKSTGCHVPATFKEAIKTVSEIYPCGEHRLLFTSRPSLIFHHITIQHRQRSFLCLTCKEVITTGFISHQMQAHQLEFPTQFHPLDLQDILSSCAQTCNEENLIKIFSTCQLHMARNQVYTSIYHTSDDKLMDTVSKLQLDNYQRVLTKCTLPPGYEDGLVSNNWSDLIQNALDLTATVPDLLITFRIVGRLKNVRAPPSETSITRDRIKFELQSQIISTKLDELFHSAETCNNINSLKEGEDYPTGLQTFYGHPYASDVQKLQASLDITSFDILTLGTSLLLKSGFNGFIRVLNLSSTKTLLLSTEAFQGIHMFPSNKETKIPIPVEHTLLGSLQDIMLIQHSITLLLEFNLQPNLSNIDPSEWKDYIHKYGQQYANFFCLFIRKHLKDSSINKTVIITGQGPLYHPNLTLSELTALSDSLSEKILAASFLARIPYLPSNGLVGYSGSHSIPLGTCAKGYVFNKLGDFSSYTQHQATRLIETAIAVKKLLDDSLVYSGFRHHVVQPFK